MKTVKVKVRKWENFFGSCPFCAEPHNIYVAGTLKKDDSTRLRYLKCHTCYRSFKLITPIQGNTK